MEQREQSAASCRCAGARSGVAVRRPAAAQGRPVWRSGPQGVPERAPYAPGWTPPAGSGRPGADPATGLPPHLEPSSGSDWCQVSVRSPHPVRGTSAAVNFRGFVVLHRESRIGLPLLGEIDAPRSNLKGPRCRKCRKSGPPACFAGNLPRKVGEATSRSKNLDAGTNRRCKEKDDRTNGQVSGWRKSAKQSAPAENRPRPAFV